MKNLLVLLLAVLITILTMDVRAQTVVPITWPFGIASSQANYIRVTIKQANKDQKKYIFILEHKPGAGGSIAVKSMSEKSGLALMGHTSSFFSWPLFNPNDNYYSFKDFTPILIQCTNQPYVIVSSKYKNFEELQKQKFLTMGTVYGSLTEIHARQLQKSLPNTEVTIVGFPGTPEVQTQVLAKNIDVGVNFPLGMMQWIELDKLNVIGASGTHIYDKNFPTFAKLGVKGFENLVAHNFIIANASVAPEVVAELHSILQNAAKTAPELSDMYEKDFCKKEELSLQQTNDIYKKWSDQWPLMLLNISKLKQ